MRRRGNAILEFALSFALLFAVFAGVFQFGHSFFFYNNLQSAVRAAARYASLATYESGTATPTSAYLSAVRNVALYGDPAGGSTPRFPGLAPSHIEVTVTMNRGVPYEVTVAISGYRIDAVVGSLTLNGKPRVTMPYMGRFAPPI